MMTVIVVVQYLLHSHMNENENYIITIIIEKKVT